MIGIRNVVLLGANRVNLEVLCLSDAEQIFRISGHIERQCLVHEVLHAMKRENCKHFSTLGVSCSLTLTKTAGIGAKSRNDNCCATKTDNRRTGVKNPE